MVYILKSATDNAPNCLVCDWSDVCGAFKVLYISVNNLADHVDISFDGGPDVGSKCAGTDPYVTYVGGSDFTFSVDLWQAYADAAWTSSVTILVKAADGFPGSQPTMDIYAYSPGFGISLISSSTSTAPSTVFTCPMDLWYTITVTDTGEVTVT